ncbi:hypothetical protein EAH76_02870 [Sphingomonas glacialis]|uniref:Nuclear transport factor 2 family protein n=2 Tax=Sphingomonas glacialis TaxID=658225 RepID=A0A502G3S7_9SPHN|nr:hypothetical protein EAH76_02870 [Sphingomonas glacialis]
MMMRIKRAGGPGRRILASCLGLLLASAASGQATAEPARATANANVQLVKTFLVEIREATFRDHDRRKIEAVAERYISPSYIQHSDGIKPGRDGYVENMATLAAGNGPMAGPMPSPQDLYWVADGDKVVWVSSIQLPGKTAPEFMFNMMRIQNGKIAEHWGK